MKQTFKVAGVILWFALALVFGIQTNAQVSTDVNLVIAWGDTLSIGATGAFSFDALSVPTTAITQEKQFTGADYFWIEDLKGADSGYYTTIQVSDLTGQSTAAIIPAANVVMRTYSTGTTLITGNVNEAVQVPSGMASAYVSFDAPITFVNRGPNANLGVLGKYGIFPRLKITIPAFQAADTYQGVITYILIDRAP